MADPHGFINHARTEPAHRPVPLRLLDWREVHDHDHAARHKEQSARCMDCGVPFCHAGCPLGNIIPEWNDLVRRDRWREAWDRLHATNNFPEFTGRICPAPCEGACVLGINDDAVTIREIELAIAEHGFRAGWAAPVRPTTRTGRSVAVVGSGPAGLAAAQQLTRAGHDVTVFERDAEPGGLMRYGVPEYKLESRFLDRRLEQMRAEGTVFRTGFSPDAADLASFDATVLATGTPVPRELDVPGRELAGIHHAMDFLAHASADHPPIDARGRRVVIIGGGDTGTDCFGSALRQGAASVTQFDIRPRAPRERAAATPWPMHPLIWRQATAHEEGEYVITGNESADEIVALGLAHREVGTPLAERMFSVNTVAFTGADGRVGMIHGDEVEVIDGRRVPVAGTGFEVEADLVLIALGFTGVERGGLHAELGVEINDRGRIVRDGSYRATVPGFYVAGDNGRGQSLIVWAIAEGRAAAAAVDADLMGTTSLPAVVAPTDRPLGV
jgi:glutamate synthase (NADPH) small chain